MTTRLGEVSYCRAYFYDPAARAGEFPLDQQLKVADDGVSDGVRRQLVKLCARLPYQAACEVFSELAGIRVSASKAWHETQEAGRRARPALQPRATGKAPVSAQDSVVIGMDGCMAHIRQQGWKEVKLGSVSRMVNGKQRDASYVAHLGGPEGFGVKLTTEAQARHWQAAAQSAVIGDGAVWIWNLAHSDFPDAAHIVDWYHARQHLFTAAQHGLNVPEQARTWIERQTQALWEGRAREVACQIRQLIAGVSGDTAKALEQEAGYLENNHERMQYADFRQAGLPIGSGVVESEAKQFKQRIGGPGMSWSPEGLHNLLPLRAAVMSGTFDTFWRSIYPL